MNEYEKLLAGAERLKNMGGYQEALEILKRMAELFPEQQHEIQLEILKIKYDQGLYQEALDEALTYLPTDSGKIFQWILQAYYSSFEKESQEVYERNMELLRQYKYYYDSSEEITVKALYYDENEWLYFYYDNNHTISFLKETFEITFSSDEIVLIQNALNLECLIEQIQKTKYKGEVPNWKDPVYLFYTEEVFAALLQCVDISGLLTDERVVLLIGEDNLRTFFEKSQVRFPTKIFSQDEVAIREMLNATKAEKEERMQYARRQITEYYADQKNNIDERIQKRKPRILFLTSYFTSVLKYHAMNLKLAAERQGLDTELLIERDSISGLNMADFYAAIESFHPDIILCPDHFRFESSEIPNEIVHICWAQDPMPHIMSKDTPAKLTDRDFVMNHFTTWKEFKAVGYPEKYLIDAPIPANQHVYRPYQLTPKELAAYSCDICFVCHASDTDAHIVEVLKNMPAQYQEILALIYKGYQQYTYTSGEFFYSECLFREYVKGAALQRFGWEMPEGQVNYFAQDMYLWFNQRVFRQTLVDWILDAGFQNIKLWGNGWRDESKYSDYAMGPAENGETLSKIYQASKIVVGNNIMTTAAARAWETMLSGGFYLSNYIPEEDDVTDIRKIITVDEDVVMFYNKEDFIQKLHYYLEHEEERQVMIEKGRKAALEKMTFDSLLEKTLKEVAERL